MGSNTLDIMVLARGFVNSASTTSDKLEMLRAWNMARCRGTKGLPDDPQVLWKHLRTSGFIHALVTHACVPLDPDMTPIPDLTTASSLFNLQSHAIITIRHLTTHPGVFTNFVKDPYIGDLFRARASRYFTEPFNKVAEGMLTNPQHLSLWKTSLIALLAIVFTGAQTNNDRECITLFDRDYVLQLIFYAALDPTAFHSNNPPYALKKVELLNCCGDILNVWTATLSVSIQYQSNAADAFFEKHGAPKITEWCRALFTDKKYSDQRLTLAATQVILQLQVAKCFWIVYAESGLLEEMVVRFWGCIQSSAKAKNPRDEIAELAGKMMSALAHTLMHTRMTVAIVIHRLRSPTNHIRDVVLLLGKVVMPPKEIDLDSGIDPLVDAIERYISERQLDKASELQFAHAIAGATGLVLGSLHQGLRCGALSEKFGQAVIIKWKKFIVGCLKTQAADYAPRYSRMNPSTMKPYDLCSWYRCPLYGVPSGQIMRVPLICVGCQTTSYCSIDCQRRDWREGRHKEQCKVPIKLLDA